ncbi:MAG: hypothetical protein V9E96_01905 [Chitinophagaceae bacterium]|jgi:hypothetical protein|nr:hypothetical protein [Chitinophagaceae bacterium]
MILVRKGTKNTIGIFQYDWELQIHTINLVNLLSVDCNNKVYLYLYNSTSDIVDLKVDLNNKVEVIQVKTIPIVDFAYRVFRKITGYKISIFQVILPGIAIKAFFASCFFRFTHLIGIEKRGLGWANFYKRSKKQKLVYYSLELYVESDHAHCIGNNTFARKMEIKLAAIIDLLIIQSAKRLQVFNSYNGVSVKQSLLLPVAVKADQISINKYFLHDLLHVEHNKKIILYFGLLRDGRFIEEIVGECNKISNEYLIVFHGSKQDDYTIPILPSNGIWSKTIIASSEINKIVSSAHIGLAFYHSKDVNHKLTAFSSEKIARYCVCGIPFIAFGNEDYEMLKDQFDCCVLITDMSELPQAIDKIEKNYAYFQQNALAAATIFDFNAHNNSILSFFN